MGKKLTAMLLACVMAVSMVLGQMIPFMTVHAASSTLIIHYGGREDDNYGGWNLWVWEDGKDGKQVDFTGEDSYGKVAVCNVSSACKVGFIVRLNEWEAKDVEEDRFVEVGEGTTEIWLTSGKKKIMTKAPKGANSYDMKKLDSQRQAVYNKKNALKINVHFYDFDKKYKDVRVFSWIGEEDGGSYQVQKTDDFGAVFQIGYENKKKRKTAGLQITMEDGSRECDSDRIIDLTQAKNNKLDVYVVQGNKEVYYDKKDVVKQPVISSASFINAKEIRFSIADTMNTSKENLVNKFSVTDQDGKEYELVKVWSENPGVQNSAELILKEEVDFGHTYTINMKGHVSTQIAVSSAFSTEEFEKAYTYEGDDLGATYTEGKTDFRLWAPTASNVEINFYEEGTGNNLIETQVMQRAEQGTWTYEATGDRKNMYYTYSVTVDGETNEAVDPYARTTGANGKRAMVVDLDSTDPDGFSKDVRPDFENMTDAVIYELHIRDISSDESSGIENKGKYLGLTESGTTNTAGEATGLDYLKELGVTHVHILPSFDYASVDETGDDTQFNWGYDPQNYNVPEGSYSTDPTDGNVRVNEYKQMVQSLHDKDIRVVMDVVYNHTFNTEDSNFQKIVPNYYYRKNGASFSNGSGCGNETASERSMMRKYIVDSVVYWATEYHVDGFRFDLMGVHDLETMQAVREALDEIDPSIMIYGEGWTGGDSSYDESLRAVKANVSQLEGVAAFSDDFRDGLKGNVFDELDTGFISGNDAYLEDVKFGIVAATENQQIDTEQLTKSEGAWASSPSQCINYVSCHDNLTLWDKIQASASDASAEDKVSMNKLAAAMTFTSQGIPFLQAGEEFLRTKPSTKEGETYDANSYASSDAVNSLKWDSLTDNKEVYEYYKGLIAFRKAHNALRMTETEDIQNSLTFLDDAVKGDAIAYTITGSPNNEMAEEIMVIHNGNAEDISVDLPDEETWSVYINGEQAGTKVIEKVSGKVTVSKISTMVLVKESTTSKALNTLNKVDNWEYIVGIVAIVIIILLIIFFGNTKGRKEKRRRKKVTYYR